VVTDRAEFRKDIIMINHLGPQSNAARDVLVCVKISGVYHMLTGITPRRCGADRYRAVATWHGGDGYSVALDDSCGVWHDKVPDEGGGILGLVVRVRGGTRAEALRWVADLAGIQLDDKPLSAEARARWAAERRELDRDLPDARLWHRAAISLAEELLDVMKRVFFTGPSDRIDFAGIRNTTNLLSRLQRIDGAELVSELHSWMESHPGLTSAMVQSSRTREAAERSALVAYLAASDRQRRAA
jgi:hypothetical protein